MLVVILGAGASYDSVNLEHDRPLGSDDNIQFRPPLASQLFDPRPNFRDELGRQAETRPVLTRIRRALANGSMLESELRKLLDEADDHPVRFRQLLGVQCYLQRIVADCSDEWLNRSGHGTHYHELVDVVEAWRSRQPMGQQTQDEVVTYITFNYDTMLEDALSATYRDFVVDSMDAYLSNPKMKLIKPHGSVNWGRYVLKPPQVAPMQLVRWLWDNAGRYDLGDFMIAERHGVRGTRTGHGVVPAIAVPVHDKDAFECPQDQIYAIEAAVRQATRVLCIGWRGVETEFLAKWRNRNPEIDVLIASGPPEDARLPADETYRNMTSGGFTSRDPVLHAGGFGSLLGSPDLTEFLKPRVN